MNAPKKPRRPRLSLKELERIDRVSTRFDRALRNGETVSIEELLAGFDGRARIQLLLDLLIIDLEYRTPTDLNAAAAEFYKRFPEDRGVVRKALQKYSEQHLPEDAPASLITFAPAESPEHDTTLTLGKFPSSIPLRLKDIDDYELLEELGRGGMGIVYLARHRNSGQEFAIKMLLTGENSTEDQIKRFLREAKTAYKLQHPNIVSVHQIGYCNGAPYFVMDYVKGQDLESLAQSYQVTQMEAALLIKTAANAIEYAHSQEIVHRDLKPSNLMLDQDTRLRITDFGLAKALTQDDTLTLSGNVLGTPAFMPPEQALANRDLIGPRSDVYSLGAVLFFLLTGRPPFQGDAVVRVLHQVVTARPPHPRSINPAISEGLATICLKCLEKKPEQRYPSGAALADDLERWQRMKPLRAQQPAIQSLERKITPKKQRLVPKWATLATAVACLVIAGLLMIPRGTNSASHKSKSVTTADDTGTSTGTNNNSSTNHGDTGIAEEGSDGGGNGGGNGTEQGFPIDDVTTEFVHPEIFQLDNTFAFTGEPFGVGKISLFIKPGQDWKWYRDEPARVISDSCRVLYPSFEFAESAAPGGRDRFTAWFLIKEADESKELFVDLFAGDTEVVRNLEVTLSQDNELDRRAVRDEWWAAMKSNRSLSPSPDLRMVNNYFLEMLQRRWNHVLPHNQHIALLPEPDGPPNNDNDSGLEQHFEQVFGTLIGFEAVRLAMMELPPLKIGKELANGPIPAGLSLDLDDLPIDARRRRQPEELAFHVPQECFYLRCGSIDNYLWVRDVVQGWGGSLDEIVAVPAVEDHIRERIERQLAFNPHQALADKIDEMLEDCALIGLDPYFRDGAAVGILFQAGEGENMRLTQLLETQRDAVANSKDATISGHPATELQQSRNEIRSWYLRFDDQFHFITNSKELAKRCVQTFRDREQSLGNLPAYQAALSDFPDEYNLAAWLYVPAPFIRNITSPGFVIEVERRRHAARELRQLALALEAAKAEGFTDASWEDLQDRSFLAEDFGSRFDDSSPNIGVGGDVWDSERGRLGTFKPIADVIADHAGLSVNPDEIEAYQEFKEAYRSQWDTASPALVTFASEKGAANNPDRVVIDIRTAYPNQVDEKLAEFLPPEGPVRRRVAMLDNQPLGISAKAGSTYLHLGLLDQEVKYRFENGNIETSGDFRGATFAERNQYVLATPINPEMLRLLMHLGQLFDARQEDQRQAERAENLQPQLPERPQNPNRPRIRKPRRGTSLSAKHSGTSAGAIRSAITGNPLHVLNGILNDALRNLSSNSIEQEILAPVAQQDNGEPYVIARPKIANRVRQRGGRLELTERPAHLWLQLRDVEQFKVIDYLEAYTFLTGRRLSAADSAVLNRMTADLNLLPGKARTRLEVILGGDDEMIDLRCPAGGVYVLDDADCFWKSTGWKKPSLFLETEVPENYKYPFLNWVKELSLESTLEPEISMLSSHLELTLREPPPPVGGIPPGGGGGPPAPPPPPPPDVPLLWVENVETLDDALLHDSTMSFRYRKLFGSWTEWQRLEPGESGYCPIEQCLELEYRFRRKTTKRLLVGAEGTLEFSRHGWRPLK
jgi:serine/threonine protein kinase